MKFQRLMNLERMDDSTDMKGVRHHRLKSLGGNARTDPDMPERHRFTGRPAGIAEKLSGYDDPGVDAIVCCASMGIDTNLQTRSFRLGTDNVMPACEEGRMAHAG